MARKRKRDKVKKGKKEEDIKKLITQIDIKDAEKLLAQAKAALNDDHSVSALNFTKAAKEVARGTIWRYERALYAFGEAQNVLNVSRKSGLEIREATYLLDLSQSALQNNEYDKAFVLAERAKFACKPEPIIGKDIIIKTALGFEEGMIKYKIGVGNKMDYPIEKISIKPYLEAFFDADVEERVISDLAPQQSQIVEFDIMPTASYQEVITSGEVMIGRDIYVSTKTTYENGNFYYKVKLTNSMGVAIEGIRVNPFIPKGFISEIEEEKIDILPADEIKTLIFRLVPESIMEPILEEVKEPETPLEWQAIQPKEGTMTQIEGEEAIKVPEFQPVTKIPEQKSEDEGIIEEKDEIIKEGIKEPSSIKLSSLKLEDASPSLDTEMDDMDIMEASEVSETDLKYEKIPEPPIMDESKLELEEIVEPTEDVKSTGLEKTDELGDVNLKEDITIDEDLKAEKIETIPATENLEEVPELEEVDELGEEEEWGSDWDLFKSLDEKRKKILDDE